MTKRTELQHRLLEWRAVAMSWVANKLFTFKQTGLDGLFKRSMLKAKGGGPRTTEPG